MIKATMQCVLGAALLPAAPSFAQTPNNCELHVWPTQQIGAVFHGASVGWNGYGAYVKGMTLTPMEEVAKRLGESVDPDAQVASIKALNLNSTGRFKGYSLVFHGVPSAPKYGNWISKDVGAGTRDTGSNATCYAELHVIFITLFRTSLSKKIQTGFLYREFGPSPVVTYKAVDAGSTGAPGFDSNGTEKSEVAKASVRQAFQENFRGFLKKKKMSLPKA